MLDVLTSSLASQLLHGIGVITGAPGAAAIDGDCQHPVLKSTANPVGVGLPAKAVNDNACGLLKRGALVSIARKLAPTGDPLSKLSAIAK
jgi:hypothetical protein